MDESKIKIFLDKSVYEAAKERIKHVINTFDTIVVMFSGGKDSLTTLHLVEEVYAEMGITEKFNVVFRDEELIPDDVIEFVQSYYHSGKYNFYYFAIPLKSNKFILGNTYDYIQWDENREWLRPKPDFAIKDSGGKVFSQYEADEFITNYCGFKGKVAFVNGIRADESLVRLRSCINKKNENYINATEIKNVKLVKPIYDWSEKDVFKYFYDKNIKYCMIYDKQMWNDQQLRVATPLHAESAKRFGKIRTIYPTYYQQLVDLFPEMIVQDRYWNDYDRYSIMESYPRSWNGIIKYINENISDEGQRKMAIKRVLEAKRMRESKLKKGEGQHNYGGYPIFYVFKSILAGQFKRVLQPQNNATKKDHEWEGK